MKAIESPVPADATPITFRPPLTGAGARAFLVTIAVYIGLAVVEKDFEYPFGAAAAVGLLTYGLAFIAHRNQGIRFHSEGLTDIKSGVSIRWTEIDTIRLDVLAHPVGRGAALIRTAEIAAADGRSIKFGSLPGGTKITIPGLVNLPHAPLLLALIADRTHGTDLFPPGWADVPPSDPQGRLTASPANQRPPAISFRERLKKSWGVIPLFLKLFKTIKPLTVLLAAGAYTLVFSWKFAVVLIVLIGFHECGHVFAMYRCGVHVKGIYFIPFFGGAAVSKGIAKTRREEAYIAANGPVWGTLLVYICLAAYVVTGQQYPVLAAAGSWGALINLFNLLPILPLDGGRLLNNLAYSFGPSIGAAAVFASLVFGAALAYFAGFELLVLMVIIGLIEYTHHLSALPLAAAAARLGPDRPLGFEEFELFEARVSPPRTGARTPTQQQKAKEAFQARLRDAQIEPMNHRQAALIFAVYAALAAILITALLTTAGMLGNLDPTELLR